MTTRNNVFSAVYHAFFESAFSDRHSLVIDNIIDLPELIESLGHEEQKQTAFEVLYAHEAWDICTNDEFDCEEPLNFEGCESASDCLMLEAKAKIQGTIEEAWSKAIDDTCDKINALVMLATRQGLTGPLEVTCSTGAAFGWFPHSYETKDGICIYDKGDIDANIWAAEVSLNELFSLSIKVKL